MDDGCLVCPFHGWKFDAEGTNVEIPYSERVNRKGRLRTYPVLERNGLCMAWYHPDESVEPMWDVPAFEAALRAYVGKLVPGQTLRPVEKK